MIVVRVELWPLGSEIGKKEIGRMYIANDGTSRERSRGNYQAVVCRRGSTDLPQPINPDGPRGSRVGEVAGFPRIAYSVWRLVSRALRSAFPEEK